MATKITLLTMVFDRGRLKKRWMILIELASQRARAEARS
jgi:hypothetical protein